jgi:peptide/nickel transport system ATP-binding protein
MKNEILTVRNNFKKYFRTSRGIVKAVDGINFSMEEGETFGLIGESGSGKSTVAYTVIGIYEPTSGEILYRDKENISINTFKRSQKIKKDIQIVFQDPGTSLNPSRTVKQILELPLAVNKIGENAKERYHKIVELLERVQLPLSYLYKYPTMLGGGEKQIVNIARALATNPSFVILDEPTSALDVSIQAKIINMLMKFQKELNLSYLFITHDLSLMRNVASRIAIMYLGKICEIASTTTFFKESLHPYTKMLLSSIPVITDEEEKLKPTQIISTGEIPSPVNIPPGCSFYSRCPKRMEVCNIKDPEMLEIERGHLVRCNLYSKF